MDYRIYQMTMKERICYSFFYLILSVLIGKLFYDSYVSGCFGFFALPFLLRKKKTELAKKRRRQLTIQFKDLILSFSNSLKAGYSLENGFLQGYQDLCFLYEKDALILKECETIRVQLKNNLPLENLFMDFAKRSGCSDILDFTNVFATAKRTGGDLNKIIRNTAQIISDKIEVREEIALALASKQMEQSIMNLIPIAILLYIRTTSPGYFDALYKNIAGICIMTVCLCLYGAAFLYSQKIMEIEVS